MTVHRAWSPRGADRFYNLVHARFFDGVAFFRVVKHFVVQFGISPDPKVSKAWQTATIKDDPVKASNTPGTITFADAGPDTRTTQVFLNLGINASLDGQGFSPFGRVTSGMSVVNRSCTAATASSPAATSSRSRRRATPSCARPFRSSTTSGRPGSSGSLQRNADLRIRLHGVRVALRGARPRRASRSPAPTAPRPTSRASSPPSRCTA